MGSGTSKKPKEGGNTMARQKSIRYQMKEALGKMASYGVSKHEQRQLSKAEGVDLTKDKVFSYG
jgi:alkylated DNA nucleotide flippase Atl1